MVNKELSCDSIEPPISWRIRRKADEMTLYVERIETIIGMRETFAREDKRECRRNFIIEYYDVVSYSLPEECESITCISNYRGGN